MKSLKKITYLFVLFLLISISETFSQGIMISDDGQTVADPSAVLEIQSNSKGLLIPRLTTSQRNSLASSAKEGLLVYDSDLGSFFIYGKTSTGSFNWNDLSTPSGIWKTNSNDVYLANPYANVGIGTSSPSKKFVIKAQNDNDTLFEILDKDDKPLMIITPNLTKIYFNQPAKGVSGGFAVGRYATAKAINDTAIFLVTSDSTRVYTSASSSKGVSGGFAVGRYATAKDGSAKKYFFTGIDSTRVYTDGNSTKGVSGGFAVGRYATAKAAGDTYMRLYEDNYFIGHKSGDKTTTGISNIFMGFQSGASNKTGQRNLFLGHNSGFNNLWGDNNIFIGDSAGYMTVYAHDNIFIGNSAGYNTEADDFVYGSQNVFIGNFSGYKNIEGFYNVYIGYEAGNKSLNGSGNVFLGGLAGKVNEKNNNTLVGGATFYNNTTGANNTTLGAYTGQFNLTGSGNVFLGYSAGKNETGSNKLYVENSDNSSPLIYGEFDNDILIINGNVGVDISPTCKFDVYEDYASWAARIFNDGNSTTRLGLKIQAGTDDNSGTNYMIGFYDGNSSYLGGITSSGGAISYGTKSIKSSQKDIRFMEEDVANEVIKNIKVVSYKDKANIKKTDFLGDNMINVVPASTTYNKKSNEYFIDKSSLMPIVVKAIQEQQEQIIEQQKEIESLKNVKSKVEKLEMQIEQLKKVIKQK